MSNTTVLRISFVKTVCNEKIQEDAERMPLVIKDIFNIKGTMTDSEIKHQPYSFWGSGTGEDKQHTPVYG